MSGETGRATRGVWARTGSNARDGGRSFRFFFIFNNQLVVRVRSFVLDGDARGRGGEAASTPVSACFSHSRRGAPDARSEDAETETEDAPATLTGDGVTRIAHGGRVDGGDAVVHGG